MGEAKTNAVRILDKAAVKYILHSYESGGAVDGTAVAEKLNQNPDKVYKTLVTKGKSGEYRVFVIPVGDELDLKKAAKAAEEKSVEMLAVKDLPKITGYIRGGCSPVGMKKQFKTIINISAETLEAFCVSGGKIGLQIEVNPKEVAKLIGAEFADIIARRD